MKYKVNRITVDQWISGFIGHKPTEYTLIEWTEALEMVYYYTMSATKTDY